MDKSIPQVAINWLLQNDTVSSIVIGARNERQLIDNLDSVGWSLLPQHIEELNTLTQPNLLYPHWVGKR
ncbi:aldo/keto reductase [Reichenbachiella sp. MSK19-1]|nr:aldo/keto reductase [Reichenbachiella sp. MSK19-1]